MIITPEEEEERTIQLYCTECIRKIEMIDKEERMSFLHINEIQNVAPKYLNRIIHDASIATDHDCLIIFADNDSKEVFGCGLDITGIDLKDCMDISDVVLDCKKNTDTGIISVKVPAKKLEIYKKRIKERYNSLRESA